MLENELSFVPPTRVSLRVDELNVYAKDSTIVNNVTFHLPCGHLMAIIGGSGSGKTTMLNVLAGKFSSSLKYDGEIQFCNGEDKSDSVSDVNRLDVKTGYLTQDDTLSAKLTCKETLKIAADLKLKVGKKERYDLVNELIAELGLRDCADTFVGDHINKGLSGGEKRRLSIAVQMIANPSVLFLDEPTTGLDAYSAFLLIKTLRKLCEAGGRTIIMSIHQPRSDILFLLDQVCLLSKGFLMYSGSVKDMIPYFSSLGYDVPNHSNPADYFIDIVSVDERTPKLLESSQHRWEFFANSWRTHAARKKVVLSENVIEVNPSPPSVGLMRQIFVLTKRNLILTRRDKATLLAVQLEPFIVGIVVGWIFYKPDQNSESGIRTLAGALYIVGSIQGYLMLLLETYRLCELDVKVYDRERAEGCVSPLAFLLARRFSNLIQEDIMIPFIFSIVTYFMFGFPADAAKFFTYFGISLVNHQASMSVAYMAVSISRDFSNAGLVGNLNFTLQSMACGFFVNAKTMPVYVRWTKYIAYMFYTFSALMSNAFTGFGCTEVGNQTTCTGENYLSSFGIPVNWISVPIVVVFCWAVGFYAIGLMFFQFKKVEISLAKKIVRPPTSFDGTKNTLSEDELTNVKKLSRSISSSNDQISITLEDLNLSVDIREIFQFNERKMIKYMHREILISVNASFIPNAINAIMGPSGSGKTSLLNLISGRVNSNLLTKFTTSGTILFNQWPITGAMFKSICCYVSQDDNHLLPNLTVYETLKYAARLRLPGYSKEAIENRVMELLRDLALLNCSNTLIGNDFVKGISGGEKRRVSIGIQLLTNPSILLLDEPTSGLDSFTSSTIVELLNRLCAEGKTIILTIHQPRAELFRDFGNVLLLAKGGRVAFNGSPIKMIKHFEEEGFRCPEFTNIADFLLDVISVNIQNDENEAISKERVNRLLGRWEVIMSRQEGRKKDVMKKSAFLDTFGQHLRRRASLFTAYSVCLSRQFKVIIRNIESTTARLAQVPGMAAILAIYYAPLHDTYTGVSDRLGLTQQYTSLYFCGMLINLAVYPTECKHFYQDFSDNVYGIGPFLLAYMTLEFPMAFFSAIVFSALTVMGIGLPRTAGMFFVSVYCSFVITTCGEALGIIVNTIFRRPGFVVNVVSVILSIGSVMSGILSLNMPSFWKGLNYISPVYYTSMILVNEAFPDSLSFTCEHGGKNADGTCLFGSGKQVIDTYGLYVNVSTYMGVLICVWAVYRLIPYLVLKLKLEWIRL